ncbi:SdpA family antimicrobial peptide system protein [Bacillus thuringiensis]|uniref:SdpA family antimicrobial peptide system protein n=1 Tax=Bacillus thuringiensis serovar toumanoffi TaxID=180862 RepID=A0ABD5I8I4_BACTU|nr:MULTISPECIES: SdpA family antimicrobial peptide system protein [Bacillus cereus group]AMR88617.1 hypothetical protein A3L20_32130 [Bacillus thuringiensis]MBG9640717.1 hypothetical protein [Bacillus thuringiensis]MBG9677042.1 hypothetical protein [Bacillus thuringiensis]MCR6783665.1 SdpA family antimicrobial peptide system protein [Bacillus thuringiensis]MCR6862022.1 SdpA family antimicrobial peptide system protein [Bacillus thuringiensis]
MKRLYGSTLVLTGIFIFLLFLMGSQNSLPKNPISNLKSFTVMKIFPQGWGFFSKPPRDDYTFIIDENGESAVDWPNNTIINAFGINRGGRSQGIEMGLLVAQVQKEKFNKCDEDIDICVKKTHERVKVKNPTPKPILCGDYTLVTRKVVPWAWAGITSPSEMTSEFVKVESICSKK